MISIIAVGTPTQKITKQNKERDLAGVIFQTQQWLTQAIQGTHNCNYGLQEITRYPYYPSVLSISPVLSNL